MSLERGLEVGLEILACAGREILDRLPGPVLLVDVREARQLGHRLVVLFGVLRTGRHLGDVAIERGLERAEVRRARGDLARVIRGLALRHAGDLLRDAEQLIVVRRCELAALGGEPDQLLHALWKARDVLMLEQHLVADRIPQRLVRGLTGLDLPAVGPGRSVVPAIDFLHHRRLVVGPRLREEVLGARVGTDDLALGIYVDALARCGRAAHAPQQRHFYTEGDRAIRRPIVVLDVVPLRGDGGDAEHLDIRGRLEFLPGHVAAHGDLERYVFALFCLGRRALNRRAARHVGRPTAGLGALDLVEIRTGPGAGASRAG
jgi:hypothetical protein